MNSEAESKLGYFLAFAAVVIGVTGYFVGLSSPMTKGGADGTGGATSKTPHAQDGHMNPDGQKQDSHNHQASAGHSASVSTDQKVVDAKYYGQMRLTDRDSKAKPVSFTSGKPTGQPKIQVNQKQKDFALARREGNRAFNGAPPTIPHPVHQTSAKSCMACHGQGVKSETLRIPQMSHKFFANCTQCHVESVPPIGNGSEVFRENTFVGIAAPKAGPRAFKNAPPQIPHSTWMRSNCLSCHGKTGSHGMKTTHPWRTNCTQCHAPNSNMEQRLIQEENTFLPPIKIEKDGSRK